MNLDLADIATKTIVEARRVAVNARRGVRACETKATGTGLRDQGHRPASVSGRR